MRKLSRKDRIRVVEANILHANLSTPEERRRLADYLMGRAPPTKLGRPPQLYDHAYYVNKAVAVARRLIAAKCSHEEAVHIVRWFRERSRAFAIRESRHLSEDAPRSVQCLPFAEIEETVRDGLHRSQQPRKPSTKSRKNT